MSRKFHWGCITVSICLSLTLLSYFLIISGIDFLATNQEPTIESEFPLKQVWRVNLDGQIDHPLARWEDKVFVRTDKSLYVLRGEDGSVVWQLRNLRNMIQEVIFAEAGWVVIRQTPESIIVVEAETGSIRIAIPDTYPTRRINGGALDEQSLYLILGRGLHVYDLKSGVERWRGRQGNGLDVFTNSRGENFYLIGSKFIGIINRTSGEGESHIRFVDKLESHPYPNVYAAARDELILARGEKVYVFHIPTRKVRLIIESGKVQFSPRLEQEILYLANENGQVMAVDINSGDKLWHYQIPEEPGLLQTPNLLGDHLYIKDQRTGQIYAIHISTQTPSGYLQTSPFLWKTLDRERLNPIVVKERLIFSQGDRVYGYAP